MKANQLQRRLRAAILSTSLALGLSTAWANDWIAGTGDWADPANWIGGVPNSAGGWAIGNIANGGTAIVSSAVPSVSEAWAGNGGVAGFIIITNGGTLTVNNWLVMGRMWESASPTPFSRLTIHNGTVNKTGDGLIVGDNYGGMFSEGELIVAGTGALNVTGGWFGIGNGNGSKGTLRVTDNATLTASGQDFNVGDYGASQGFCYLDGAATINVSRFWIGKSDSSFGVLRQTGGALNGTGGNANEWCIGGQDSAHVDSFGYYDLAGGTLTTPFNFQIGRHGKGVIYQSGGSASLGSWTALGRFPTGIGVVWVSGGTFSHTGGTTQLIVGEEGRGELTVSGSGVLDCNLALRITNPGGSGQVNLNGGTAAVPGINQVGSAGSIAFNGGTLKAKTSNPNFLTGLADARIYAGHAIFDTDGNDITIAQALMGAVGSGVVSIPVTDPGAGYQAPPIVQVIGDGYNATAVAQINPVAGTVTNILVTCPGYYYWSPPAVLLVGGAPTTPAQAGTPTLGPVTSGGVIKQGAGTLTLSGPSDYSGPTVVQAGRLISTTDAYGAGAVTVADGAAYGVRPSFQNGQLGIASLALGTSTGASLEFDLGSFGNPVIAPLNVMGNLAINATVTVNIEDGLPQLGMVPLLQYASRSGAGNFALGTLPAGVTAGLVHDTVNRVLYLNITGVGLPRWDGQAGGNWDVGITTNWVELSTGLPTTYSDGAPALFNDSALGTTTVNLVATVQPSGVTFTNIILDYTLTGPGKLSGSTALIKGGPSSLTLAQASLNDYTGPTLLMGGTLNLTNLASGGQPSAIGKSSAAPTNLVIAGGVLNYSGPSVAIDRGYRNQGAGSNLRTEGNLTLGGLATATLGSSLIKSGPARLTYTGAGTHELSGGAFPGVNVHDGALVFDGSAGGQVMHTQNEFWVGGSPLTSATLILTNTTLNVDSWFAAGRGNGTVGNTTTVHLYDSVLRSANASMGYDGGIAGNLASQTMTLHGNSSFTNNGDMNLGESSGSTSHLFLNDNSRYYNGWRVHVGWHTGATGALTLAQSAAMRINAWFSAGHEGGHGTLTLKDNSSLWVLWDLNITDVGTGQGALVLQDNARIEAGAVFFAKGAGSEGVAHISGNAEIVANNYYVANAAGAIGTVHQSGGTVIARPGGDLFQIGVHGPATWNLSGGTVQANNHWVAIGRFSDGPGTLNVSGGAFHHNDPTRRLIIGEDGNGILNVSNSGLVTSVGSHVAIAAGAASISELNLNGGTFVARRIEGGEGFSTLNFNGGTLRAGPNANADFLTGVSAAYVLPAGAIIDSGAQNIRIAQALLNGGGGLTKLGTGTLALLGANTYGGTTLVSEGALAGTGSIAGAVTVASGARLSPGLSIGALTINGALTLQAGSVTLIEVAKTDMTSDQVVGTASISYGGTLVLKNLGGQLAVGDTFTVFPNGTRTGSFATVLSDTPGQTVTWDTSRLTVDGTVRVASATTTPVTLVPVVSDGQMTLSWPLDQIGWELQMQTNPLSIGISDNWVPVPGSTVTNSVTLPISAAAEAVFFRLVFP